MQQDKPEGPRKAVEHKLERQQKEVSSREAVRPSEDDAGRAAGRENSGTGNQS
ncbi:hypothetical protein [Dongia deserti]|uniref:hypothetical protein n=1 Tax=Dongia deserti TaxID=2268030 RepID=UPI0013C5318B|nr:hypothetical protein [Dongia deserti]